MTFAAWLLLAAGPTDAAAPARCRLRPDINLTGTTCNQPAVPGDFCYAPPDCCTNVSTAPNFRCATAADAGPPIAPNILLIVSDDQAYCFYGFMAGYCSTKPTVTCRSNVDCPKAPSGAAGDCLAGIDGHGRLRLNDPSCRYRQLPAPRPGAYCAGNPIPSGDSPGGPQGAFVFDLSNFPCTGMHPQTGHRVAATPHLDQLATEGAVFPRAYATGNSCKPARATLIFGKEPRHLAELGGVRPLETMAYWLKQGACVGGSKAGALCSVNSDCGTGATCSTDNYLAFVFGKSEVVAGAEQGRRGFDGGSTAGQPLFGRFDCTNPDACVAAVDIASPAVPEEARTAPVTGVKANVLDPMFQFVPSVISVTGGCNPPNDYASCRVRQQHPFFLWYAPWLPHIPGRGGGFGGLYAGEVDLLTQDHLARVTQLDVGSGALLDELAASCVCVPDGAGGAKRQSLLDNTIIVFLTDQGFFLPQSKFSPTDNNLRTPLIVSVPDHRLHPNIAPPRVFSAEHDGLQLAHSIDVLKTVLSYAHLSYPKNPVQPAARQSTETPYPFARDLTPYITGTPPPNPVRRVVYVEDTLGVFPSAFDNRERFMTPLPGELGLCRSARTSAGHVRPCLVASDCGGSDTCALGAKRCTNDPAQRCFTTADCAVSLCVRGRCNYDPTTGSFGDVARPPGPSPDPTSRTCSSDVDCVPLFDSASRMNVCQPVLLKVGAMDEGIISAWDLNWDPDQAHDLLADDPKYLGEKSSLACDQGNPSLGCNLLACLEDYWALGPDGKWLPPSGWRHGPTPCPWPEPGT